MARGTLVSDPYWLYLLGGASVAALGLCFVWLSLRLWQRPDSINQESLVYRILHVCSRLLTRGRLNKLVPTAIRHYAITGVVLGILLTGAGAMPLIAGLGWSEFWAVVPPYRIPDAKEYSSLFSQTCGGLGVILLCVWWTIENWQLWCDPGRLHPGHWQYSGIHRRIRGW